MKKIKVWGLGMTIMSVYLLGHSLSPLAVTNTAGKTHIGTFEGSTTFTTSSSNGINPGLFLEVRDADGNLKQYTSEDGVITVPNTKEGGYVTQAKLLGKTKYRDQDTGELLDEWEAGRNLALESVQTPVLTTTGKNLFDGVFLDGRPTDIIPNMLYKHTGFIEVKSDENYTIQSDGATDGVYFFNENKELISTQSTSYDTVRIKTPRNCKYISVQLFQRNEAKIQVERGTQKTTYEPYKSNILTVNEDVTLRSNGDVYNELNLLTGRLTQRIDENNEVLAQVVVKTVDLNSTYQFDLVSDSVVQVKESVVQVRGDILPTIYSITVPTDSLTFSINPNAEKGQQFIAPEFSITNESPCPVRLELKSFTQTTNVLNDVLPDAHSDWTQLNLAQSRDIALALVPKPSDGWLTLNEGEKYVANTSNTLLGEIKRKTTVDFSFSAFHGGVFDQNLFPEYRLVFTFGF